jgi:hypothetical protein
MLFLNEDPLFQPVGRRSAAAFLLWESAVRVCERLTNFGVPGWTRCSKLLRTGMSSHELHPLLRLTAYINVFRIYTNCNALHD